MGLQGSPVPLPPEGYRINKKSRLVRGRKMWFISIMCPDLGAAFYLLKVGYLKVLVKQALLMHADIEGWGKVISLSYISKIRIGNKIYSGVCNMLQHTCPPGVACAKSM